MNELNRWYPMVHRESGCAGIGLSDEGDFVDFSDYAAMLAEKDAEIERLRDAIVKLQAAADPNPTIVSIVKQALAATAQGDNNERNPPVVKP